MSNPTLYELKLYDSFPRNIPFRLFQNIKSFEVTFESIESLSFMNKQLLSQNTSLTSLALTCDKNKQEYESSTFAFIQSLYTGNINSLWIKNVNSPFIFDLIFKCTNCKNLMLRNIWFDVPPEDEVYKQAVLFRGRLKHLKKITIEKFPVSVGNLILFQCREYLEELIIPHLQYINKLTTLPKLRILHLTSCCEDNHHKLIALKSLRFLSFKSSTNSGIRRMFEIFPVLIDLQTIEINLYYHEDTSYDLLETLNDNILKSKICATTLSLGIMGKTEDMNAYFWHQLRRIVYNLGCTSSSTKKIIIEHFHSDPQSQFKTSAYDRLSELCEVKYSTMIMCARMQSLSIELAIKS